MLRCPWHGWDYCPLSGKSPAGYDAGPGATNLLTGMWDARMDRSPILALTGQVDTQVLGPGAFQEVDLAAAFAGVAAMSHAVYRDSRHVELANLACKNAILKRDVAHLIFPDEVQTLPSDASAGSPEAWAATQTDDERFAGRPVVAITGDGGFGQYLGEVTTAVHHRMNITHVLLNNSELGKISKEQRAIELPVWMTELTNPNFADFVTSCGGLGIRVEDAADLDGALRRALDYEGPATVEIVADPLLV